MLKAILYRIYLFLSACLVLILVTSVSEANQVKHTGWYYLKAVDSEINLREPNGIFFDSNGLLWIITQAGIISFDGFEYRFFNNRFSSEIIDNRFTGNNNYLIHGINANRYRINTNSSIPIRIKKIYTLFNNLQFSSKPLYYKKLNQLRADYGSIIDRLIQQQDVNFYRISKSKAFYVKNGQLHFINNGFSKFLKPLENDRLKVLTIGPYFVENTISSFIVNDENLNYDTDEFLTKFLNLKKSNLDRVFKTPCGKILLLNNNALYLITYNGKFKKELLISNFKSNYIINAIDYNVAQNLYALAIKDVGIVLVKKRQIELLNFGEAVYGLQLILKDKILTSKGLIGDLKTNRIYRKQPFKRSFSFLHIDKNGFWIQNNDSTISIFNNNLKKISEQRIKAENNRKIGLKGIIKDRKGCVWSYSNHEVFQELINPLENSRTFVSLDYIRLKKDEEIETIHFKSENLLWIGTMNRLIEVDLLKKKTKTLIEHIDLRTITVDGDGDTWLGTYGQGALIFKDGNFKSLTLDKDNTLISCHTFFLDKNGVVWISSDNGLFAIRKNTWLNGKNSEVIKNSFVHYYSIDEGIITEFNGGNNACVIENNDTLFLASMDGVVFFNPETIIKSFFKPNLLIYHAESDKKVIKDLQKIILPNDFNLFQIKFLFPNWINESNYTISYAVEHEGRKPIWRYIQGLRQISIPTLPSGNYKLVIRIQNKLGKQISYYKTLSFYVEKSFFETSIFYFLVVIFSAALILFFIRQRQKFLVRERNALKKQVEKQIKELYNANVKLELTLSDLTDINAKLEKSDDMKARMMSIFVHDLKAPMRFLSMVSKHIFKSNQKLEATELAEIAENIYVTSHTSLQRIEQFLIWQSNEQNEFKLNLTHFPISKCLDELFQVFSIFSKMNNNVFSIEGDPTISMISDIEILKIVLWNLLDNANKNTQNGHFVLKISSTDSCVFLEVKDTGVGMDENELKSAREALYKSDLGKIRKNLGLKIIGDFVGLLGGTVDIYSEGKAKGSRVTLKFDKGTYEKIIKIK